MSWYGRVIRRTAGLLLLALLPVCGTAETTSSESIDPKAAEVMRDFTSRLKSAKNISFRLGSTMTIKAEDVKEDMSSVYDIFIEKPDKIALLLREGSLGSTIISNGTTITMYSALQNAYVQRPAPNNFDELLTMGGLDMGTRFAAEIWSDQPYESFMEGVTSGVYLGITDIENVPCHHLKFSQERFDWEAWVSNDTSPTLRQLKTDFGTSEAPGNNSELADMTFGVIAKLSDWKLGEPIPAETFNFSPPPGATDASEMGAGEEVASAHPLLGAAAPETDLPLLDGGAIRTADLTSTVVVLDFWATWCGPCRRALPILEKVAGKFSDKPVRFFAVNVEETTDTIQKFVDDQKLGLSVALDQKGETGREYGIESIPTTFLIGKDGRIQAVHEGLSPSAEEELTSQIEALLRGETLADPHEVEQIDGTTSAPEMTQHWTHSGDWTGVAYDPAQNSIIALGKDGQCARIDTAGKETETFKVSADAGRLRLAQLDQTPEMELLTFSGWGDAVYAFSSSGDELWNKPGGSGIDDVAAGDLTGDGIDEVAIGYNGGTGLHALTSDGQPLWEYKNIGNVWHVNTGDVDGDGKTNVVTTSAAGKIHIFGPDGKKQKDISPGFYGSMVRVSETTGTPTRILATGSGRTGEVIGCFDNSGKKDWQVSLTQGKGHVDSAAVSSDGKLIAVGVREGTVYVIKVDSGEVIGKATGQGRTPEVGWATADNEQLVLVATGDDMNAFTVPGTASK